MLLQLISGLVEISTVMAAGMIGMFIWEVMCPWIELQFDLGDWKVYAVVKAMVVSSFPAVCIMSSVHPALWTTLYSLMFAVTFVAIYAHKER